MSDSDPPLPPRRRRIRYSEVADRSDHWWTIGVVAFLSLGVVASLAFGWYYYREPVKQVQRAPSARVASASKARPPSMPGAPGRPAAKPVQPSPLARFEPPPDPHQPRGPAYDPKVRNVALLAKELALDSDQSQQALAALEKYRALNDWHDRTALVYKPDRAHMRMIDYYTTRQQTDPTPGKLLSALLITAGESSVVKLVMECMERATGTIRVGFHRAPSGQLLLDWESYVAYGAKSWPDFKKERTTIPTTMRVIAEASDYYNYEFSDEWRLLAVKMRSADGMHSVTGYVEKRSGLGIALGNQLGIESTYTVPNDQPMPILQPPGSKAFLTVKIAFPPQAQSNSCVKIIDVVADRWQLFDGEE